ncbi:hypothetical protein [Pseudomonas anguilliseptica]|uniref:hypothetical protein n=1 Tax=Pseudomonas anguilliseptica TaxID=53406 RepID=UPI0022AF81C7|nr:hypothetical protein [Pseudomonas anguilliseptica]MCZ4321404.1 hypothetical protein [Pseudomonas anguilliseptica]
MDKSPNHASNPATAQSPDTTLCKAIDLLNQAHRYLGQSNSIRAMDLSREVKEFIAQYRSAVDSDNSPKT